MKLAVSMLILSFIFGCRNKEDMEQMPVSDKFELYYNNANYDSIHALFSSQMKDALPLDKTKEFFIGLKAQAGQIAKRQFVKYHNATYAQYKTDFERALFAVNISLDKD